jgi:ribonuclease P protein component
MRPFSSLRTKREFTLAMRRGAAASTPAFTVYAFSPRRHPGSRAKVGFVVTKHVGKAVVRNLVRRRCKAVLETALRRRPPLLLVIRCRPEAATLAFSELRRQLLDAMARAQMPATARA